jgi:sulfate transport system permease protein
VLIGLVLGWFALLVLVPSVALVRRVVEGGYAPFVELFRQPEMRRAFGLSLGIGLLATVINALFGVAFALVLVRQKFWGKALADGVVDLPFAVSPIVAGLMLVVLYGPGGWLGQWLEPAGYQVVYAVPGMVLATLFVTLPFVVREVVPVLQECGTEAEQAAATLGARPWTIFWRITLPSMRWGLAYGITLSFSRALGEFGAVLVVSGNLIGKTQTATLAVHDGIESFQPEGAYAAAMVLGGASFLLLIGMEALRKRMSIVEDRA